MKVLNKYLIKEIFGPFIFGVFTFTSIYLGIHFLDLLNSAEKHHFSLPFIVQLISLLIPQYLTQAAPVAVLLAALLGLGNLTSHSETIAMRAGGMSYAKLAVPVLIIGMAVSVSCVLLNEYVVPVSLRTFEKMKDEAINQNNLSVIYNFNKDFYRNKQLDKLIYAEEYLPKEKQLHKVVIQEFREKKLYRTILATVMYWRGRSWFFDNAEIYLYNSDSFYPMNVTQGKVKYPLNLTPKEIETLNEEPEKKSITELNRYIAKFAVRDREKQSLLVDLNLKIAIPFASLVFALLGTPLALRPQRRSNAAGFGLCIIFILVWYILMGLGTSLARGGSIPPFLGAWMPNIILAGYGVLVFTKVKS
jgi:lipopolysaccharide export system permease protein